MITTKKRWIYVKIIATLYCNSLFQPNAKLRSNENIRQWKFDKIDTIRRYKFNIDNSVDQKCPESKQNLIFWFQSFKALIMFDAAQTILDCLFLVPRLSDNSWLSQDTGVLGHLHSLISASAANSQQTRLWGMCFTRMWCTHPTRQCQ